MLYLMGKYNSSKTRVRPFFRTLLRRDPAGVTWLPQLFAIAPQRNLYPDPELLANPGRIVETCPTLVDDYEMRLAPPEPFLRWLLLHPDRLTWPRGRRFGPDTQNWRERLMGCRDLTNEPEDRQDEIRESDRQHAMQEAFNATESLWCQRFQAKVVGVRGIYIG